MKNKQIFIGIAIIVVALLVITIVSMDMEKDDEKIKVGFIMSGHIEDEGWNGMHYNGIKKACDDLGAELIIKENVAEFKGECKRAVKELAKEEVNVIILSSYNYTEEVYKLVKEYPDIAFYGNSSEYHEDNMTSYFVRYYQGRYLAGVLAGLQTKSDKIGYVAAMANNEVNRGINAFTLGVRSVNKKAKVLVSWTGSWDNEKKEKEVAKKLIDKKKVDVITYHQNQSYVIEVADEKGISSIGYHEVFSEFSDKYLGSVICNWEMVYKEIVKEILHGRTNSEENFWLGMEKEVVDLEIISDKLPKKSVEKIKNVKTSIAEGKEIFSGVIYDNKGEKRCDNGESISDDILLEHMDWYVEGVKIYEDK
jgi:basic membrane protein A